MGLGKRVGRIIARPPLVEAPTAARMRLARGSGNSALSDLVAALRSSPALLPLQVSGTVDGVDLIRLTQAGYRAASFLDSRLLGADVALQPLGWPELERAAEPLSARSHFIFHTGHVGSTLLSRLLGEHPQLFSVREPALLREAAAGPLRDRIGPLLRLFSRTWRPEQTALIKATSFVSQIAPDLLAEANGGQAILLTTTPPVYLRAILAGDASRREAVWLAASRLARLSERLGYVADVEGEGERIAMSWLCEVCALHAVYTAAPERCLWLDFDRLLAEPQAALVLALRRLRVDSGLIDLPGLLAGPMMRRYAKAPEHAYDAELRRQVLEQAGRETAAEVRRGMDWLQRQVVRTPALAGVLQAAANASRASLAAAAAAL